MKKVVFLDVDGVLNTPETYEWWRQTDRAFRQRSLIENSKLTILKRIVEETGAVIVLSSSWRVGLRDVVEAALGEFGMSIHCQTTDEGFMARCDEIATWLQDNPQVQAFAIIDDLQCAGWKHPDNFFQCDGHVGLTEEQADRIIGHLNTSDAVAL